MPIISILIFLSSFILILLLSLYTNNKQARVKRDQFLSKVNELAPIVFQNVKIRYWTTNGLKTYVSLNNFCDLYLFNDFLSIVRRQNLIIHAPILLSSGISATEKEFDYLEAYKIDRISFKQVLKGEVDIKLSSRANKQYTVDLTLKGLSRDQIVSLKRLKSSANQ